MDVPAIVSELMDDVRQAVGVEPTVIQSSARAWRVTAATDRVVATVDFKRSPKGRVYWVGNSGRLWVDGLERAAAENLSHLARITANPGGEVTEPPPIPPQRAPSDAPVVVQQSYWMLARRLGTNVVQLGSMGGKRWVIGFEKPGRVLQIHYTRCGRGKSWALNMDSAIVLVIDGMDRSAEAAGSIANALALLTGDQADAEGTSTVTGPAAGEGYGSVGVRRHSVIRN